MPLSHFRCPDGETISAADCLAQCRMAERCVTKPTLTTILAGRREWNGKPSTTQLLNGTMMEYLKITHDYAVSPRSLAYSLLGSTHHAKLAAGYIYDTEHSFNEGEITGIVDLLEPDERSPGWHMLTDYKTYGSYRVAKILGVRYRLEPSGELYKRSGPWGKAGTPAKRKVFYQDPDSKDDWPERMQLNFYRILAERAGYKISSMRLQITVRDGGVKQAAERGVTEPIYYPVYIDRMHDDDVLQYFEVKRQALLASLNTGVPPQPCNDDEAWGGRRCRDYCEVAEFCPRGRAEKAKGA